MKKLNLVAIFMLASSVQAQSYLIDASMRDLSYERPANNSGNAGNISFTKLELKRPSMNMTLDNGSRVFDSRIELSGKTVNLKGNNHRLRFSFSKAETVSLLDQAEFSNIRFRLTDDVLTHTADRVFLRSVDDSVDLSNYKFECNQHPSYDMRDTETIMYGCMRDAKLTPVTGSSLSLAATYTHAKLGPIALTSKIKDAKVADTYMSLNLGNTHIYVNEMLDVKVDESLQFSCQKTNDVTLINKDKLINDCSNDFTAHLKKITVNGGLEMGPTNEYTSMGLSIEGGFIGNGTSSIMVQAQKVLGGVGQKAIEANKVSLRCNKDSGFTEINAANLKRACTSNMELRTLDSSRYSLFKMSDTDEDGTVTVKGLLNNVKITNSKVEVKSGKTIIDHPKMEVRMFGVNGYAAKDSGALNLNDFDAVAKKALTNFKLERNDVVIKSKTETDNWKYLVIEKVEGSSGRLKLDMPAVQTVAGDNIKTFYGVKLDCNRRQTDDLSIIGIVKGCTRSGTIELSHLIKSTGIKARAVRSWYPSLLTWENAADVVPSNLTIEDTYQVYNMQIQMAGNVVWINLEVKIAGIWKSVTFEGSVYLNEPQKRLEITRVTSNIPESILNFGIEQSLPADLITVNGSKWYINLDN